MRPPGPCPSTCVISTPISRARRRTEGAAGTLVAGADGCEVGGSAGAGGDGMDSAWGGAGAWGEGRSAGAAGFSTAGSESADAAVSMVSKS